MTDADQRVFRRKIIGEHVLRMLPLNVVMTVRIQGYNGGRSRLPDWIERAIISLNI